MHCSSCGYTGSSGECLERDCTCEIITPGLLWAGCEHLPGWHQVGFAQPRQLLRPSHHRRNEDAKPLHTKRSLWHNTTTGKKPSCFLPLGSSWKEGCFVVWDDIKSWMMLLAPWVGVPAACSVHPAECLTAEINSCAVYSAPSFSIYFCFHDHKKDVISQICFSISQGQICPEMNPAFLMETGSIFKWFCGFLIDIIIWMLKSGIFREISVRE